MPEPKRVTVMLDAADPKTGNPGRVTIGYYIVDGDLLTMTGENGKPIVDSSGGRFQQKLNSQSDAEAVAILLTRKIRELLIGDHAGFSRVINYPSMPMV